MHLSSLGPGENSSETADWQTQSTCKQHKTNENEQQQLNMF